MVAHVNSRVATNAHTAPNATWTAVTTQQSTATRIVRSSLWWKIATQTDVDAVNFTFTVDNSQNLGAIVAFIGHEPENPIVASQGGVVNSSTSTAAVTTGCTPTEAGCHLALFGAYPYTLTTSSGYSIATSDPGTWVETNTYDTNTGSSTSTYISMACGWSAARTEVTATSNTNITQTAGARSGS